MAECKDCIHYCVCSPYTAPSETYPEVGGCGCFKPTADVIPKEFLTRKEDEAYERGYAEGKTDAAREIFEEIERHKEIIAACFQPVYSLTQKDFCKLKEKYTEV